MWTTRDLTLMWILVAVSAVAGAMSTSDVGKLRCTIAWTLFVVCAFVMARDNRMEER